MRYYRILTPGHVSFGYDEVHARADDIVSETWNNIYQNKHGEKYSSKEVTGLEHYLASLKDYGNLPNWLALFLSLLFYLAATVLIAL